MTKSRNIGLAVHSISIANGNVTNAEVEQTRTEKKIEIAERVEIAQLPDLPAWVHRPRK